MNPLITNFPLNFFVITKNKKIECSTYFVRSIKNPLLELNAQPRRGRGRKGGRAIFVIFLFNKIYILK